MASHGAAREATIRALSNHQPFRRSGFAMSATDGSVADTGRMPAEYAGQYREAVRAGRVVYTVLSYTTPIAWVLDDGTRVIPDVKYSATTSQHRGMARTYL